MINNQEILDLINKNQEGGYWDFKEKWHENKAALLHDIICLANNLEKHDGYLIIGVNDDYTATGVNQNDSNKKNTQQLTDFLRDKNFVGSVRPIVRVEAIKLDSKTIEVIVIENSRHTPYVLSSDCRDGNVTVRTGNIYTRIQDTNTPIDKTADNDKQEQLWRKRFSIDDSPLEKVQFFLQNPDVWEKADEEVRGIYYCKYAPEYSIVFSPDDRDRDQSDFLCKIWPDSNAKWTRGVVKVYDHTLFEFNHAYLDGARIQLIVPCWEGIKISNGSSTLDGKYINLTYLVKGTLKYLINEFLINKRGEGFDRSKYAMWSGYVIVFESEQEKQNFKLHIQANKDTIKNKLDIIEGRGITADGQWTELDDRDWKSMEVLKAEYEQWKTGQEL